MQCLWMLQYQSYTIHFVNKSYNVLMPQASECMYIYFIKEGCKLETAAIL